MKPYCKQWLCTIIICLLYVLPGFAQKHNLVISGNIKLPADGGLPDACCFYYQDILSGKNVVIPIMRNSVGDYKVTIPLDNYQQFSFSQAYYSHGSIFYNTAMTEFSFFGKPGQTMRINVLKRTGHTGYTFKGDFAIENQQYQNYNAALQRKNIINPYSVANDLKGDYSAIKKLTLKVFNDQTNFNAQYFKTHKTSDFVKQQAYYNTLYRAQSTIMDMVDAGKINEAVVDDFYKTISAKKVEGIDKMTTPIGNPNTNTSIKNQGAIGNEEYREFIDGYYRIMNKKVIHDQTLTLNFADFSKFVLQQHPELSEPDKQLLSAIAQTSSPTADQKDRFLKLRDQYVAEYFTNQEHNLPEFDYFMNLKDPELRDLYATISLYKLIDTRNIDYIKPNLNAYNNGVKNTFLKNKFFIAYQKEFNRMHGSKLSSASIINSSDNLKGPDLFNAMINKYKGKVIYVDFWATWCGPCIEQMRISKTLKKKLAGKNVVFLNVCVASPAIKPWKDLIAAENIEGEHYFMDIDQTKIIEKTFNISTIPHYAIVNQNGTITNKNATFPADDKTLKEIQKLLEN